MSYEIENYGKQRTDGLRQAGVREPNFPPNYAAGQEDLAFTTDILCDPADTDSNCDPEVGWESGLGIGSQTP